MKRSSSWFHLLRKAISFQLVEQPELHGNIEERCREWESEIDRLRHIDPRARLLDLRRGGHGVTGESVSSLGSIWTYLCDLVNGNSETYSATASANRSLDQVAQDLYLSHFGILYSEVRASKRVSHEAVTRTSEVQADDNDVVKGDPDRGDMPIAVGQSGRASTMTDPGAAGDPTLALLESYIGPFKRPSAKRPELFSQWIEGTDPEEFVFNLDKDAEVTPGMQRRARQEAREARKRRRAETLLQLQREHPGLPSTQPAPERKPHSQPSRLLEGSSQTQAGGELQGLHTLSQPLSGAFGRRELPQRPSKRSKRRGGF